MTALEKKSLNEQYLICLHIKGGTKKRSSLREKTSVSLKSLDKHLKFLLLKNIIFQDGEDYLPFAGRVSSRIFEIERMLGL